MKTISNCSTDRPGWRHIFLLLFFTGAVTVLPLLSSLQYPLYGAALVAPVLLLVAIWLVPVRKIVIHASDFFAGGFLLWLLLVSYLRPGYFPVLFWFPMVCTWIAVRMYGKSGWLFAGLIVSALVQSVMGELQLLGHLHSHHILFPVTGSFFNPGIYGQWMALSILALMGGLLWIPRHWKFAWIGLLPLVFLVRHLWLSDSRTAWLAVMIGIGAIAAFALLNRYPRFRRAIWLLPVLLTTAVIFLYGYKKDSADGRMLIWKVSLQEIVRHPLIGQGPGSFPATYSYAQADYFEIHPDDPAAAVAGNTGWAFNEYITLTYESGLIGLVLFLLLVISAFRSPAEEYKSKLLLKAMLAGWLICGFFSYPLSDGSLRFMLVATLALLPGKPVFTLKPGPVAKWTVLLPLFFLVWTGWQYRSERETNELLHDYATGHSHTGLPEEEIREKLVERWPDAARIPAFTAQYARTFFIRDEWAGSVPYFQAAIHVRPSAELLTDYGRVLEAQGEYERAENCYQTAGRMVPSLLVPDYLLFRLYQETGRENEAIRMAVAIDNKPAKVTNSKTLAIKYEIREFLNRYPNRTDQKGGEMKE